jgi:UDP-3-O-[3-hydroxymyristoyl] glucosamine N-acyltransferase
MALTVSQLAKLLQAELIGNSKDFDRQIIAVNAVSAAGNKEITFVADKKHQDEVYHSKAAAVIVKQSIEGLSKPQLIVKNIDAALIEALTLFAPKLRVQKKKVDTTARLGKNVQIEDAVSIGAYVIIDDGVKIGKNSIIGAGCKIGENTKIGQRCRLDRNVVIEHNCLLGNNVIIQANSTIGSTGFGYAFIDAAHRLIPHNGGVVIEDFVEIGANCCIDRAKFGNTIIGAGTKIDNLVQIAHNVVVGKCCLISAQVGIAGSCQIGDGVVMAGQVGLADNIKVGATAMLGAQAGVMSNVPEGQKLAWSPAIDVKEAVRVVAYILRLPKMAEQLKKLNKRIERLEASKDHKR